MPSNLSLFMYMYYYNKKSLYQMLYEGTPKFHFSEIVFLHINLSILPLYSFCQPLKLISNLSPHVLIIIIKSREKIYLSKFHQNSAECKNPDFFV